MPDMMTAEPLFAQVAALRGRGIHKALPTSARRKSRPVIGLPTTQTTSQRGRWALEAADAASVRAILDAGADPYFFPCRPLRQQEDHFEAVWAVLRRCDGVLLPGGDTDVHPGWYRETLHPLTVSPRWWEDWWKIHVAQVATLLGMPFLGICQGLQYWAVVNGGSLYQDIRSQFKGAGKHRHGNDTEGWQFNAIRLLPVGDSQLLQCACHAQAIWGACMHHQAVRQAPTGLVVTAVELDGVIAALERVDGSFGLGIQWHPEQRDIYGSQLYARALFRAFVEAAQTAAFSRQEEVDALYERAQAYLRVSSEDGAAAAFPRLVADDDLLPHIQTQAVPALTATQVEGWLRSQDAGVMLPRRR